MGMRFVLLAVFFVTSCAPPRDTSRDIQHTRVVGSFSIREDILMHPTLFTEVFEHIYTVTDPRGVERVIGSYTDETRVGWHDTSRVGRYLVVISTSHFFAVDVSAGDLSNPRLVSFRPFNATGFHQATEGTISSVEISGSIWRVYMESGSTQVGETQQSFVSYDDGVSFELESGRAPR